MSQKSEKQIGQLSVLSFLRKYIMWPTVRPETDTCHWQHLHSWRGYLKRYLTSRDYDKVFLLI